ncbi:MAG: phage tail protein I [Rhodobacteraceae bacterium]|nr:MAG: phage tail protein I [Paracoccaceae bacterium]
MSDSLLPHNATKQERDIEAVIGPAVAPVVPLREIWNTDSCPEDFLPWLAHAYSVDAWDSLAPLGIKRQVVQVSFAVHQNKGTRKSVETALGALGFNVDLSEWFEYGGAPYTFRIDAYGEDVFAAGLQIDTRLHDRVTRLIEHVKPARAHFDLRIGESFRNGISVQSDVCPAHRHDAQHVPRPSVVAAHRSVSMRTHTAAKQRFSATLCPRPTAAISNIRIGVRAGAVLRAVNKETHIIQGRITG